MNDLVKLFSVSALCASMSILGVGCDSESESPASAQEHADDHDHADEDHDHDEDGHDHDDEVSLGTAMIGDIEIEASQGHGEAAPGKELHLVVKLPYSDSGASEVRVWIGTEDRFASVVERAQYASSHDDYDAHAVAPDPLPDNAAWWIEITKPDGTVEVGSIELR